MAWRYFGLIFVSDATEARSSPRSSLARCSFSPTDSIFQTAIAAKAIIQQSVRQYGSVTVSTVVVTWNRRELLRSCLQSLTMQRVKQPFEVVVVDNGSDDGSPDTPARQFSQLHLFRLQFIRNADHR